MPKPKQVTRTSHREKTQGREPIPPHKTSDAQQTPPKHDSPTSRIDAKAPYHSVTHPNIYPWSLNPRPTKGGGGPTKPQYYNTLSPHPNNQLPTNDPTGVTTKSHPADRPMTKADKNEENNDNHANPQHPHHHYMCHMHPDWHPINVAKKINNKNVL